MDEGWAEREGWAAKGVVVGDAGTWDASGDCNPEEVACAEEGHKGLHLGQHNRAA